MTMQAKSAPSFHPGKKLYKETNPVHPQAVAPYPTAPGYTYMYPATPRRGRSISFLTLNELLSYKAIPALGVFTYLTTSVGAVSHRETFMSWFGSEHAAIQVLNGLTLTSIVSIGCYIYGRRHICQAGTFQKVGYPLYGSLIFNCASHFCWAVIKEMFKNQDTFDCHWRILCSFFTGVLLLSWGRSYLNMVDEW